MEAKQILLAHMGISEGDYNEIVFHFATAYLFDQEFNYLTISLLQQTPIFWKWWTNQFERRNSILVKTYGLDKANPTQEMQETIRVLFADTHKPWSLNLVVNRLVLERTFDEHVAQEIIKNEREKYDKEKKISIKHGS